MLDPVRAKARVLVMTAAAFVGGVVLASGLEWTTGVEASTVFQTPPSSSEVRPVAELSQSFISIAESVTPAVVSIQTQRNVPTSREDVPAPFRRFYQPDDGPQEASGTGFLISDDGYILTNNHVVADADVISVLTMDRREFRASLVGRDPTTDVAVIKIDGANLPTVRIGDPDETQVGEWVLAIGNPLGLNFTVTAGIVSAKDRGIDIIRQNIDDSELAALAVEAFIQTDAAINPGNSGGPLVNIRGEVIGINSAIASRTGLSAGYGFAVPINLARRVAEDLIRYGRWRRSILGVHITEVSVEDVEAFGLPSVAGAVVQDFGPIGDAEKAGLRQGDVIVAVNGEPVNLVNELQRLIAVHRPGDKVTLDVIRYGDRLSIDVPLAESTANTVAYNDAPSPPPVEHGDGLLGIKAAPLTADLANSLGFGSPGGVVIEELAESGALAERFPARGFKILEIDRQAVTDVADFERIMRAKKAGSVVSLLLGGPGGEELIVNVRMRS